MKVREAVATYQVLQKRYTYQDYLDLPADGKRYEIINGELVMVPAPFTIHQKVAVKLEYQLLKYLEAKKNGELFHAPFDVVLSEHNVVQPDILVVTRENSSIITDGNIKGAPDFIIEIISPATAYYDLLEKKDLYAQHGVREYWIVDPKRQCVEIYLNNDHQFELQQRVEREGMAQSHILEGLKIQLEQIFGQDY